jgi:hypothetical protein
MQLNGGSVADGLALAKGVRYANVVTVVTRGSVCASACFMVFPAGAQKIAYATSPIVIHSVSNWNSAETSWTMNITVMMAK